jgi:aspartokinase
VSPLTGPPAARAQASVSRALSASARTVKPAARAGVLSRVQKPANSGSGSHIGSERGPLQRRTSCASRNARSTQVSVQSASTASAHAARNSRRVCGGPIPS